MQRHMIYLTIGVTKLVCKEYIVSRLVPLNIDSFTPLIQLQDVLKFLWNTK